MVALAPSRSGDVAKTAEYLQLPLGLVQAAVTSYGTYRGEIDGWIERTCASPRDARRMARR
jgi:hypothetical protein